MAYFKAIKLYLLPNQKNVWKTKEKIKFPLNQDVEYNYIIFKNNNILRWEYIPNNKNRTVKFIENDFFVVFKSTK